MAEKLVLKTVAGVILILWDSLGTKNPSKKCRQHRYPGIWMTPHFMHNMGIWINFSTFQKWKKKKSHNVGQNLAQNQMIGMLWVTFLECWYLCRPNFNFPAARSYQNQTWVTPKHLMICQGKMAFIITLLLCSATTSAGLQQVQRYNQCSATTNAAIYITFSYFFFFLFSDLHRTIPQCQPSSLTE